ncbi:MAG: hypothetical protein ACOY46_10230 [Bacillota bacterium]
MHNGKFEKPYMPENNGFLVNGDGLNKTANGEKGSNVNIPRPRTPSELLLYITNYVNMLHDMKGINNLGKETLTAADETLTRGQSVIRKSISEIKRREEGQMQLHFSVRNAFYGVTKASGEDSDVILEEAKAVALSVGRQLNLPDIEKYVNSLVMEYKNSIMRPGTAAIEGKETAAKYRIAIDGKTITEKCRRNNMELARILYKHGITEGEKSEDCKALGIDITDINDLNHPVEYRLKRRHLKIERIK